MRISDGAAGTTDATEIGELRYCGSEKPAAIMSTANEMAIHFHSDKFEEKMGFSGSFQKILCDEGV